MTDIQAFVPDLEATIDALVMDELEPEDDELDANGDIEVRRATLPPLAPAHELAPARRALDFLEDVDLDVTVELGRARMPLRQVLDLAAGTIIELDKLAGDPVDILVNEKLIGRGEVVVVDDLFGVRVTEIIPPGQRWKYR